VTGEVDLHNELGENVEPLGVRDRFRRFCIDLDLQTIGG
jgi:hypothetical protein